MMRANPCKVCGSTNLKPKWDSEAGVGWVHCDECGNIGTAVSLTLGREAILARWNAENPAKPVPAAPQDVCSVLQRTIDWMEDTIPHDQLPPVYDLLVATRNTFRGDQVPHEPVTVRSRAHRSMNL